MTVRSKDLIWPDLTCPSAAKVERIQVSLDVPIRCKGGIWIYEYYVDVESSILLSKGWSLSLVSCDICSHDLDIRHRMDQEQANTPSTLLAFSSFMNSNIKSIPPSLLRRYLQTKPFTTKQTLKMPLVVPGINSGGDSSKTEEWTNKLVGKKIGDGASDEVVCSRISRMIDEGMLNWARLLRGRICQRKREWFSLDRWLPRTSSLTGEFRALILQVCSWWEVID